MGSAFRLIPAFMLVLISQNYAAAQAGARDGSGRNATVNRAAYKLGRLVDAYLDAAGLDVLVEQLVTAAVTTGLPEREARTAVASGLAAGRARPRTSRAGPIA